MLKSIFESIGIIRLNGKKKGPEAAVSDPLPHNIQD